MIKSGLPFWLRIGWETPHPSDTMREWALKVAAHKTDKLFEFGFSLLGFQLEISINL